MVTQGVVPFNVFAFHLCTWIVCLPCLETLLDISFWNP